MKENRDGRQKHPEQTGEGNFCRYKTKIAVQYDNWDYGKYLQATSIYWDKSGLKKKKERPYLNWLQTATLLSWMNISHVKWMKYSLNIKQTCKTFIIKQTLLVSYNFYNNILTLV